MWCKIFLIVVTIISVFSPFVKCRDENLIEPAFVYVHRPVGWPNVSRNVLLPGNMAFWRKWSDVHLVGAGRTAAKKVYISTDDSSLMAQNGLEETQGYPLDKIFVAGKANGKSQQRPVFLFIHDITPQITSGLLSLTLEVPSDVGDLADVYEKFRTVVASAANMTTHQVLAFGLSSQTDPGSGIKLVHLLSAIPDGVGKWLSRDKYLKLLRRRFMSDGDTFSFEFHGINIKVVVEKHCLEDSSACRLEPESAIPQDLLPSIFLGGAHFRLYPQSHLRRGKRSTHNEACKNHCFNGGTASQNRVGSCKCDCPFRFNGPKCEQLKFTLQSGRLLEKNLAAINFSGGLHLSFDSLVSDTKGNINLLEMKVENASLNIRLKSGEPTLTINQTDKSEVLTLAKVTNLNDWLRLDVIFEKKKANFLLNLCKEEWSPKGTCQTSKQIDNLPDLSNSNLVLGDRQKNISACISNVRVNGHVVDLSIPDVTPQNETFGCALEKVSCGYNENEYGYCGENGICNGVDVETKAHTCSCKPGYNRLETNLGKAPCNHKTKTFGFGLNSRVTWNIENSQDFLRQTFSHFQVKFRSVKRNGSLLAMIDGKKEFQVKIVNSHVSVTLKDETQLDVTLQVSVSDGEWHVLRVSRIQFSVEVLLDNEHYEFKYIEKPLGLLSRTIVTGGSSSSNATYQNEDLDFQGCMSDVRMSKYWDWMPLQNPDPKPRYIDGIDLRNVTPDACNDTTYCEKRLNCSLNSDKQFRWGGPCTCQCPSNMSFIMDDTCVAGLCDSIPCENNGTCINNHTKNEYLNYTCICPPGFTGFNCNIAVVGPTKSPVTAGLPFWVFIVIALVLLLMIIFILLILFWRRRREGDDVLVFDEDIETIHEGVESYPNEEAGEEDFKGYIDFRLLQKPKEQYPRTPVTTDNPQTASAPGLERPTAPGDWKNPAFNHDDFLDHPLEYGYEGEGSIISLSSVASGSTDRDMTFDHLQNWGDRFDPLKNLYRKTDD